MQNSKSARCRALFWTFTRIGLVGFGGGPAMIPLIQNEVVKRHGWVDNDAFADILAIGNTLPGPIATKLPGYIGYRVAGITGCCIAVVAITLPMIVAMILLLGGLKQFQDVGWIQGMGLAVLPVVMVMMLQLTLDFGSKSRQALGSLPSLAIGLSAGGLIYWLGIHPGVVVAGLLIAALALPIERTPGKTP